MATKDYQTEQRPTRHREQEALAALRAHRQASGYVPWDNGDNDRLRALDRQRQRRQQDHRDYQHGLRTARSRDVPVTSLTTPAKPLARLVADMEPPARPPFVVTVRLDPELARVAVGLGKAAEFRLWCVLRHSAGVPGWTTRRDLLAALQADGIPMSGRHLNRLLAQGRGLFWDLDRERIWLRAYVKVSQRLTEFARRTCPALVRTNIPGAQDEVVPVGGDIGAFKARVYAAWLDYREDPTIARSTLGALFNVSEDTLRNWEARLGEDIHVVANYAQTHLYPLADERVTDYLPAHCYCYVTRGGEVRTRWRLSNTYQTPSRQYPRKGQSRKARTAAAQVAWDPPVESRARSAFDRSHRVPKRYFDSAEQLQAFLKRHQRHDDVGIAPETPRYVFLGRGTYQHGVWELSLDGYVYTSALERMPVRAEYSWWASRSRRLIVG